LPRATDLVLSFDILAN